MHIRSKHYFFAKISCTYYQNTCENSDYDFRNLKYDKLNLKHAIVLSKRAEALRAYPVEWLKLKGQKGVFDNNRTHLWIDR